MSAAVTVSFVCPAAYTRIDHKGKELEGGGDRHTDDDDDDGMEIDNDADVDRYGGVGE